MHNALRSLFVFTFSCFALAACGASNPYGHGREYVPRDDEEGYYEHAVEVSYEDVRREPKAFQSQLLGWFGVVSAVEKLPNDEVKVALDLRFHQPRHVCRDQFEDSCRITISERAGGPFTTSFKLALEDKSGPERLAIGSLVKVYGSPSGDFDDRGGPVITAKWYRQWPHGAYVTTAGRVTMRQ